MTSSAGHLALAHCWPTLRWDSLKQKDWRQLKKKSIYSARQTLLLSAQEIFLLPHCESHGCPSCPPLNHPSLFCISWLCLLFRLSLYYFRHLLLLLLSNPYLSLSFFIISSSFPHVDARYYHPLLFPAGPFSSSNSSYNSYSNSSSSSSQQLHTLPDVNPICHLSLQTWHCNKRLQFASYFQSTFSSHSPGTCTKYQCDYIE